MFGFPALLALLASAAPSVQRGDTTCVLLTSGTSCTFEFDGIQAQVSAACDLAYPGPNLCSFGLGSRSGGPTPVATWKPRMGSGVFLKVRSCGGGCNPMAGGGTIWSNPVFDHAAGWMARGATGTWIVEMDSVRFLSSSPRMEFDSSTGTWKAVPASAELAIRPRWSRVPDGRPWAKWTDSVEAPRAAGPSTSFPDAASRVRRPLLRWIGNVPGRLDRLRCLVREASGEPWLQGGTGTARPHPFLQLVERDSVQGWVGGHLPPGSRTLEPLRIRAVVPSAPVEVPVGAVWNLEASLGWDAVDSSGVAVASPLPEPWDSASIAWRRVSATWSWELDGLRDSLVVLGWIPSGSTVSIATRAARPGASSGGHVDAMGRIPSTPRVPVPDGLVRFPRGRSR